MKFLEILAADRLPRWFWPLLLGLNLAMHLPFFQLPPTSVHTWRQCNTMAVARNLYEEGMNPLKPRVDRRKDTDGVTGMQFPSYEWVVAGSYRVLGFNETWPRVISWLMMAAGLVAFYALVRRISGSALLGALGAWGLSWSPEIYFHGINALPDILALTASTAGLWWFVRWRDTRQPLLLFLSLLGVTLGGLTKLQFLVVGFPIAVFVVRDILQRRLSLAALGLLLGYALVAVGLPLAWYAYALKLIESSGLNDFGLELRPASDFITGLNIFKRNLLSDWPELLLGYGMVVLLLVGLWRLLRRPPLRHEWFLPGLAWSLALAAYYFIELRQMEGHTYYQLPLLPPLLLLGVWGAAWLRRYPRGRVLLLVALVSLPLWAFLRVNVGRWMKPLTEPIELTDPANRLALETATPPEALCVVGPDISGCKYFYFLHKKGFGFDWPSQLVESSSNGKLYVADCIDRGARYLYTNDSTTINDVRLRPYLDRQVRRVGSFQVWALRPAPAN
ncbi:hypothetical protein GCM10023185_30620 [Hymenobacter saemangeumensis]|uniref:Glycosyltransferase RgtA/B/C/D-like domain-containing protein n=1 Tax=Hymenobacter saemangeumensis TaxID=1084522 RepID=A0ABP8IM86_9BACT